MHFFRLLLFPLIIWQYAFPQTAGDRDITGIKQLRQAFNTAIAARDSAQMAACLLDNYVAVWANGSSSSGREAATARMLHLLRETPGLIYVRTPERILISDADTLAFETGKWSGLKTSNKDPKWLEGRYTAMWWKQAGVWKLRSELYVGLKHY